MEQAVTGFLDNGGFLVVALAATSIVFFLGFLLSRRKSSRSELAERARHLGLHTAREGKADVGSAGDAAAMARQLEKRRLPLGRRVLNTLVAERTNFLLALAASVIALLALIYFDWRPGVSAILAMAIGYGALMYLRKRGRAKRLKTLEREFPAAIDLIVRGMEAGLPMMDCLALVAQESDPVIAHEFRVMLNEISIGMSVSQATARAVVRVPIREFQIFSIVIAIQSFAGGGITESLNVVADSLRSRARLREKISIMSSEARASALIIGSLPILVMLILFIMSPAYMKPMFDATSGRWALAIAAGWGLVGVQVMRTMINFDV